MRKLPGLVPKFVISRNRPVRRDIVSVRGALVRAVAKVGSKRRRRTLRESSVLRRPATETLPCALQQLMVQRNMTDAQVESRAHSSKRRSDRPLTSTAVSHGVANTCQIAAQRPCADAVTASIGWLVARSLG